MRRLLVAELAAQWRTWLGMFVLATMAAFVLAVGVSVIETAFTLGGEFQAGLSGMAGMVLSQLLIVSLAGSLLGIATARPVAGSLFDWGFPADSILYHIPTSFGLPTVAGTMLAVAVLVLLGGWKPARRAASTAPLEVLREGEPKTKTMGWLRWVLSAAAAAGLYGIAAELFVPNPSPASHRCSHR